MNQSLKHFFSLAAAVSIVLAAAAGGVEIRTAGPERPMVSAGAGEKAVKVGLEGSLSGVTLRGEIRKWGEKKIVGRIAPVPAKRETELSFELAQPGIYQITFLAERGKEIAAERECSYSAVPPLSGGRPAEMGTCTHFAQGKGNIPYTFELLKLAGFTRIRDDLAWGSIESKPGEYRIRPETDRFIDAANRYGIKPLLVTGYNNGAYPGKFTKAFVTTPEMREAYGNAVAFAVKHFGDRVAEWELWNEPNSADAVKEYLPMLEAVYPKIKAVRPEAVVISCGGGGAGGGPGGAMIVPIAKAGGIEFQDGFSIHPYMAPHDPDFGYRADGSPIPAVSIPVFSRHLANFIEKNPKKDGSKLKLYITELGWPVEYELFRELPVTEALQAAYFARTYLLNRAGGNFPLYWYDFQNDGLDRLEKEHNFGLINLDYSPKPAYQAAATFASLLGNKPFTGSIVEGTVKGNGFDKEALRKGVCKINTYGSGNDAVTALWCAVPSLRRYRIEFKLPLPYEEARLIDWQGAELPMPKKLDGNRVDMDFAAWPKYIVRKSGK